MRIAVWYDTSLFFSPQPSVFEWGRSANIEVPRTLRFDNVWAVDKIPNVRRLRVHHDVDKFQRKYVWEVLERGRLESLQCLIVNAIVNDDDVILLAKALKCTPKLEQIFIRIGVDNSERMQVLIDALKELPLIAFGFSAVRASSPVSMAMQLSELLFAVKNSLKCLEIHVLNEYFWPRFFPNLSLPKLRILQLHSSNANETTARDFVTAIKTCRALEQLRTDVVDSAACVQLAKFFEEPRRHMFALTIGFGFKAEDGPIVALLKAVRTSAPVESLELTGYLTPDLVSESGILQEGWITRLVVRHEVLPPSFEADLLRNKQRHSSCRRACVMMIAIRRSKLALTRIAVEVVLMIAKFLFETRNQVMWDN